MEALDVISFTPRPLYSRKKTAGTNWRRNWVDPRVGLDVVAKKEFLFVLGIEYWSSSP
jgi:hypothetical protein